MSRVLLIVVVLLLVSRLVGLDVSPSGFFSDEAGAAYNMLCLGSASNWSLFLPCSEGDGAYPLIFIYLGSIWVNFFGASIYSYRLMGNLFIVLTLVMLYPLALNLYRRSGQNSSLNVDRASVGLWTCFAAAISPWSFQMGRFVSENSLALLLFTGALLLLSGTGTEPSRHRRLAASLCLALSMYAYSPLVVVAPLLVVAFALFFTYNFSLRFWFVFFALLAVFVTPLFYALCFGSNLPRVNALLLWQPDVPVADALIGAGKNFLAHFSPSYLFLTGDNNLRHSSQYVGLLSPVEVLGIAGAFLLRPWRPRLLGYLCLSWAICILPGALTNHAIPHSWRTFAGLIFVGLLAGWGLAKIARLSPLLGQLLIVFALAYFANFTYAFYAEYPERSESMIHGFEADVRQGAEVAKLSGDWKGFVESFRNYRSDALQYYLISWGGMSCRESHDFIKSLCE